MAKRLIDADALHESLKESYDKTKEIYNSLIYDEERQICGAEAITFVECMLRIKEAPTIEAEPVRHGRWETTFDDDQYEGLCVCSVCGEENFFAFDAERYKYCPNCGAKMDGRK